MATAVDTELVLAFDVSGSIDDEEFALQQQGYYQAFRDANVIKAMLGGTLGQVAVCLVFWAGYSVSAGQSFPTPQILAVNWKLIDSSAASYEFASSIESLTRPDADDTGPRTGTGDAIIYSTDQILNNDYTGTRKVIDISSDGKENTQTFGSANVGSALNTDYLEAARDYAIANGIDALNGLLVIDTFSDLESYYNSYVNAGTRYFNIIADTYNDIVLATLRKIKTDILLSLSIDGTGLSTDICELQIRRKVNSFSGLDHLEGETVSILADGQYIGQQVVSNGAITLDDDYAVVHVGLPINSDLQTNNIEIKDSQ